MPNSQAHHRGTQLVPRARTVPQIEEHLPAPRASERSGRPPILAITGPQGIGKTTLLSELNEKLGQRTPRAVVDCSRYSSAEIPRLLVQVKLELGRYCPGIGRLRFRRLEIGLAATRQRIEFSGNPRRAERTLIDLILREILLHPRDVGGAIDDALGMEGGTLRVIPSWLSNLTAKAVAAAARLLSRRLMLRLLRRPLNWYGHRDRKKRDHPLDVLAALNQWAFDPGSHDRRDERLIEGLLADIRDLFGRGRLARYEWHNCVLLLDNVDTDVGQAVLKHLLQLRLDLQIVGASAEPAEPLLVVTTSRRPLPDDDAVEQHRLPELNEPETGWLVEYVPGAKTKETTEAKQERGEADHRFHLVLHQLTGGYPAAAATITDAACRRPVAASGSLDALLTVRLDDADSTVEDQVLDDLVNALLKQPERPFPDDAREDLVTCALAHTLEDAEWLAANHSDTFVVDPALLADTELWNEDGGASAPQLLRRLLLRRLAVREDDQSPAPTWTRVCGLLRERRRRSGDLHGELFYALADDQLDPVARHCAVHLSGQGLEGTWLDLLKFVTEAPRRGGYPATSPYEQQVELAKVVADDGTMHLVEIARLIAGLWLSNDACASPDRRYLHEQIAMDYRQIAPDSDRPIDLRNEAKRHDALAQKWS